MSDHPKAKRCFLLAMTRSGTRVLRELLTSHPAIRDRGEVLNSKVAGGYFEYLEDRFRSNPALCRPANSMQLFSEYVESCAANADSGRFVVFDLKYECLQLVYRPWEAPGRTPALFEILREKADFIIHLTRRNYLRQFLSATRAHATRRFHVRFDDRYDGPEPVSLPTRGLVHRFEAMEALYLRTQQYFHMVPGFLQIDYGLLFDHVNSESGFSNQQVAAIAKFLRIADRFDRIPRLRRTGIESLPESIANYDEVARTLQGTRFENLLE